MENPSPGKGRFPLTLAKTKKVWDGTQDPLLLLSPQEAKAAELYVSLANGAKALPDQMGRQRLSFGGLFRDYFGFDLTTEVKKSLLKNPAWLAYVEQLKHHAKQVALARLDADATNAVDDYLTARDMAKDAKDYKELRLASQDALDRIGASRRVQSTQGQVGGVTIILKSRNFEHAELLKQLPPVEAEVVEPEVDDAD